MNSSTAVRALFARDHSRQAAATECAKSRISICPAAEVFYSPASISYFLRSTRTGKAYWFGNITGPEAYGNHPRFPLVMAEVDEETGFLKKGTKTVVDDRDPETDSPQLQLSNFTLLEDRETRDVELYLTRLGATPGDLWRSDAYRYRIVLV